MRGRCIVDMHTHILPEMDDGSPDVSVSLAMGEELARQGVSVICSTSHYYAKQESISRFLERREEAREKLEAKWSGDLPRMLYGAEVAFFSGIGECHRLEELCLTATKTLMLEMPFAEWSKEQVEEVDRLLWDRDYKIVLVHPERFLFSKKNRQVMERFAEMPIAFQVNADTLSRWMSRRQGSELLQMTKCPLLGSDSHNMTARPPRIEKAREYIEKTLGTDFLAEMDENASDLCGLSEGTDLSASTLRHQR